MRKTPLIAAAAAVSALATTTVLAGAGAGVANAQHAVTFTSPSSLSTERGSDNLIYTGYDNRSGRDLVCDIVVSNNAVVSGLDRYIRSASDPVTSFVEVGNWPAELQMAAAAAANAGEFNVGLAEVDTGHNDTVEILDGTDYPMSPTFPVQGLSMCVDASNSSPVYVEFERTPGGGIFGSVENLFGSAS